MRVHKAVGAGVDLEIVADNWIIVTQVLVAIAKQSWQVEVVDIEDCAAAMTTAKGKLLLATANAAEIEGLVIRLRRGVKCNETVGAKEVKDVCGAMRMTIRPRSLAVFTVDVHVVLAGVARGITDEMHRLLNGQLFRIGEDSVRIYYASGTTGAALNKIGEVLEAEPECIVVSGDDGVTKSHRLASALVQLGALFTPFIELDGSQFDMSQKFHALKASGEFFKPLGMPARTWDFVMEICSMPYKLVGDAFKITGENGYQLATGVDLTNLINGVPNLSNNIQLRLLPVRATNFVETAGASMGFKMTSSLEQHISNVTFLKGWWQLSKDGMSRTWVPLVSAVCKIGKTERPARLFSSTKKNAVEGLHMFAYAMARSMGTIPRDYPILGAALSAYDRLGLETRTVVSASEDAWFKPTVEGSVDRNEAIKSIVTRYGITQDDILRVESLYRSVDRLPALLVDDVFIRLAEVDYGYNE